MDTILLFLKNFSGVFTESAPWLILGFFIAGLIKAFIPEHFLAKHLGGNDIPSVIKAATFGAPLPLCSCGVIPAALGLRRNSASKAATTSFLIATPETGVDSVSITYALLGPFMAIIRPIAAITTAITAGILVVFFSKKEASESMLPISQDSSYRNDIQKNRSQTHDTEQFSNIPQSTSSSCCDTQKSASQHTKQQITVKNTCCSQAKSTVTSAVTTSIPTQVKLEDNLKNCCASKNEETDASIINQGNLVEIKNSEKNSTELHIKSNSCCSKATPKETTKINNAKVNATVDQTSCCASKTNPNNVTLTEKLASGLTFTFVDLIKDIAAWLLIGLALAALILTLVPASFLATWGATPYAFLLMAAIGVPMYICATSSTPIAAGLLFAGVSPGAILVFLLVGPATNIATIGVVKKELGSKVLGIYLATVVGLGFVFGWLTNRLSYYFQINIAAQSDHVHNMVSSPIVWVSSVLLAVLLLNGLRLKWFN